MTLNHSKHHHTKGIGIEYHNTPFLPINAHTPRKKSI